MNSNKHKAPHMSQDNKYPVQKLLQIKQEAQQLIRDKEHWNSLNLQEQPFDMEWERLIVAQVNVCFRVMKHGTRLMLERALQGLNEIAETGFSRPNLRKKDHG